MEDTKFLRVEEEKKPDTNRPYLVILRITDKQMKVKYGSTENINWTEPVELRADSPEEARVLALALAFETWSKLIYDIKVESCEAR